MNLKKKQAKNFLKFNYVLIKLKMLEQKWPKIIQKMYVKLSTRIIMILFMINMKIIYKKIFQFKIVRNQLLKR